MAYLSKEEIEAIGFRKVGANVSISNKASIYGASSIEIGNNVRIDDFCLLSAGGGKIILGNHIHIAAYTALYGGGGIEIKDFSGISSHSSVYSASDDYSGNYLLGPVMDEAFTKVIKKKVVLEKYVTCGSHSVILPGVTIGVGAVLGACSFAVKDLDAWWIYSGLPAQKYRERLKGLLVFADQMEKKWS